MKTRNNLVGSLILSLAALIWGLAFVAQAQAADRVPPFLFNALRSLIASLFLFGLLAVTSLQSHTPLFSTEKPRRREMLAGGLLCGVLLAISVNFQQFGLAAYPEGAASEARAGFLTALYVILVPLLSVFFGKRIGWPILLGGAIATAGIYLLSLSGGPGQIYLGDILVFCCAISFACHIMVVDKYGDTVGGIRLSMLQFLVCGILSLILSLCFEHFSWRDVFSATPQILYLGIMSSGIAYTLQIYGQKFAEPAVASLSMSLESVFAALGGWLISGNALEVQELIGCGLVFAAIVLAQLPQLFDRKHQDPSKNGDGK